ncbi:MAG: hypothetical protein Tsb002_33770 [Wenzhouxiangellaceae bacterium]
MNSEQINQFLLTIDGFLGSAAYFPFLLLGVGLFFTLYLKFPQIRYFGHAWKVVSGKFSNKNAAGDTSHFGALTTALSGTVGTGNIGGVALAIHLGGPAAVFWMWATAFLGMATKFVEVTLSHKYRIKTEDGTIAGGPMYVMERALNMKWLAVIFAIAMIISAFGTGNMPQINSIASGLRETFDIPPIWTGAVLSVLLFLVVVGGIKRIARVTEAIVPTMAGLYIVGAFAVIFSNLGNILPSFMAIIQDIFSGSAATGGFIGASFAYAFNRGVNRGLFSNEAGQGSAPIAHAAARGDSPVSEGVVSILEPFIDTIIICTITALVLLSSGVWSEKFDNDFQRTDMQYVAGTISDQNAEDRSALYGHLVGGQQLDRFDGVITVANGVATSTGFTLINARSVAENVTYRLADQPFSGELRVSDGRLISDETQDQIIVSGKSLLHSVPLTTVAFTHSPLGEYGQYIVAIGLLLFAFSTAIAWSYYGNRATVYLFGQKGVLPYRILYIGGFFLASFADTTVIWTLSAIAIVLTTLPNLLAIMLLRRDMRETVEHYWTEFRKNPID